ncbi:hypothetical protein JCM10908_004963 [Rhodotorula pacifica]|uniref:uncharacterized protein n=1 Tax=Rhodotorula pacifica TaxID=1495444 RepID=UPI0031701187
MRPSSSSGNGRPSLSTHRSHPTTTTSTTPTSSSRSVSYTHTHNAALPNDDDDETWDEASDDDLTKRGDEDDLSARLGHVSLKSAAAAPTTTGRSSISPIRTAGIPSATTPNSKTPTSPNSASASSSTPSGSTWSFNPFSMRPSARPSHASTSSSSLFGGPSATSSHTYGASPVGTPSALYAYSRAAPPPIPPSSSSPSSAAAAAPAASPSLGAEAVAAALSGSHSSNPNPLTRPGAHRSTPERRGTSYLAGASRVQEEADRCVEEKERRRSASLTGGSIEKGGTTVPAAGQGQEQGRKSVESAAGAAAEGEGAGDDENSPGYGKERCRRAVRRDVADLVKDPAHVLARLRTVWQPRPPVAAPAQSTLPPGAAGSTSRQHSDSITSEEGESVPPSPDPSRRSHRTANGTHDGDDEEGGPSSAGYVPLNASSLSSHSPHLQIVQLAAPVPDPEEEGERGRENRRKRKFLQVLEGEKEGGENVDLAELRKLAWSGVPNELRPMVWQLLLGYLPAPTARRATTLARKRSEYASLVKQAFSRGVKGLDGPLWHQISIDVPRTRPGVALWQAEATQRSLERVLYVWAIRHPASGYVQGINDLVTPFFQVFLASYIDADPETFDVSVLAPEVLEALEADSFWCLSKLLDGIQDNYIFAQPGIQRLVKKMETLCARVDAPLAAHLKEQGVEFIQFAFRWMNCLLMRELSVKNIVRMWDTYLAEGGDAFSEFHLYVCLAFLVRWSDQLREMDFQSIIMFLQSLPTQDWSDKDTELLLSEAFMWSRTFVAR